MRLLLRAAGSPSIGLGHVMRCVSVAQEATDHEPMLVVDSAEMADWVQDRHGCRAATISPGWTTTVGHDDVVLFDGYHLPATDIAAAHDAGSLTAAFTDGDPPPGPVDVLINPGAADLPTADHAGRAVGGTDYALVRQGFLAARRVRSGPLEHLVVTLGGSDATGQTPIVLAALDELASARSDLRVTLVDGPAAPDHRPLADGRRWLEIVRDPPSLVDVFDRADLALAAAGSTTWELLAMGVPTILVPVAENQSGIVAASTAAGAAIALEPGRIGSDLAETIGELDPDRRRSLSEAALALIDGRGAERIVALLAGRT